MRFHQTFLLHFLENGGKYLLIFSLALAAKVLFRQLMSTVWDGNVTSTQHIHIAY